MSDGNGWVECGCGERHWGRFGAAGLLLFTTGDRKPNEAILGSHDVRVLMQHRAAWSADGDTWGVPGGACDSHEDVIATALRETFEETGIEAASAQFQGVAIADHGVWSYTTVLMSWDQQPTPIRQAESTDLRWIPAAEVAHLVLHPGFAHQWPRLAGQRTRVFIDAPSWLDPTALDQVVAINELVRTCTQLAGRVVFETRLVTMITVATPAIMPAVQTLHPAVRLLTGDHHRTWLAGVTAGDTVVTRHHEVAQQAREAGALITDLATITGLREQW